MITDGGERWYQDRIADTDEGAYREWAMGGWDCAGDPRQPMPYFQAQWIDRPDDDYEGTWAAVREIWLSSSEVMDRWNWNIGGWGNTPDAHTVRFSKMTAEADAEMAAWEEELRGRKR